LKSGLISNPSSRRIFILREDVARKIAAGEVIDRPLSVVRELLDNAIDSQAKEIDLSLENGGLSNIVVSDNGQGMSLEDLELSVFPHATSKIREESDLETLDSLGFRGEALSSIASVSHLTIHSAEFDGVGNLLTVFDSKVQETTPKPRAVGTTVSVRDLFFSVPARRKFMKSQGAELSACRRTFEEKILPFPEITFRLFIDSKLLNVYPPGNHLSRGAQVLNSHIPTVALSSVDASGSGWTLHAVYAKPEFSRRDRSWIHIYINKRRVMEFSLVQAVQYAFGEYQPGGAFPYCVVFLQIDPSLVDFNIHPAKREVRIKNLAQIHHGVVEALRNALKKTLSFLENKTLPRTFEQTFQMLEKSWTQAPSSPFYPLDSKNPESVGEFVQTQWRYLGQVMNLYLLVEWGDRLVIVDQHAAHERINFDRLKGQSGKTQLLLVPLEVDLEEDTLSVWEANRSRWESLGVIAERSGVSTLLLKAVPSASQGMEEEIKSFLQEQTGSEADLERELYARLACRSSIMAGENLDRYSADNLLTQVFQLPVPRCPHGRPLWIELNRETLDGLFGRLI